MNIHRKVWTGALVLSMLTLPVLSSLGLAQGRGLGNGSNLLKNIRVAGVADDGTVFEGALSIADIGFENGRMVASGVLRGKAGNQNVNQVFENAPLNLTDTAPVPGVAAVRAPNEPGVCDVLFLDLGPLFLDLLGLTVDLAPVVLDIDAVPGPGNLLGNLLCALTGLLDPDLGLGDLLNNTIQSILNAINQLL
jgi:hypothetical protein